MGFVSWLFGPEPALWIIGTAIGAGLTVALAPQVHNIRLAHVFFGFAWIWALGCIIEEIMFSKMPLRLSLGVAFLVCGTIGVLAVLAHYWVEKNHAYVAPAIVAPPEERGSAAIQLDASVTLASGSFDESCGMWIAIGAGAGKLLSPANVAADLRATNLTDHPVRILEILATVGEDPTRSYLFRLPFYETKLIFGDLQSVGALHQLASTTSSSLSFQENAKNPIPARQSIDGWVLFEYPNGLTGVDVRSVRFVARTDYGDFPVSGLGMGTFTGGGAHLKPLPDAIDFREYHVERYSTFIKQPSTPQPKQP
jgi:hypothetical protein